MSPLYSTVRAIVLRLWLLSLIQSRIGAFAAMIIKDKRDLVPQGFVSKGAPNAGHTLTMRAALAQTDIKGLEEVLYNISTPGSPKFLQHLTKEEMEEYARPSNETVAAVDAFFASHNVSTKVISSAGDWISFSIPVNKANEMFDANFTMFEHSDSLRQLVRTMSYSIPSELDGHLDLIYPTTSFDVLLPRPFAISGEVANHRDPSNNVTTLISPTCQSIITPLCLQQLYGIPFQTTTQARSALIVTGFNEQFAELSDLQIFLQNNLPDVPANTTILFSSMDGGSNSQEPNQAGAIANLNVQYSVGLASEVAVVFCSVGNMNEDGDLHGFLDLVNKLPDFFPIPQVLSISYGMNENNLSPDDNQRFCTAAMMLGTLGTSIIVSSGNGGVEGDSLQSCSDFVPTFPSTCPYVTSVGSTTGISTESAVGFTSGGFSNVFARPTYQETAVDNYLSLIGNISSGRFNSLGRAYPDVAAQGENVLIIQNGMTVLVSGTEASNSIFSSIIALINNIIVFNGGNALGYLNPMLYSPIGAAAFKDITSGNNPGCGTDGFPALEGWDAVSGVGTPNFARLLNALFPFIS